MFRFLAMSLIKFNDYCQCPLVATHFLILIKIVVFTAIYCLMPCI